MPLLHSLAYLRQMLARGPGPLGWGRDGRRRDSAGTEQEANNKQGAARSLGNAAMMFAFLGAVWHANQAGDAAALMNQVRFLTRMFPLNLVLSLSYLQTSKSNCSLKLFRPHVRCRSSPTRQT